MKKQGTMKWMMVCVCLVAGIALGGDNNWATAISSNWNVPANWSLGTVPTSDDDVWFNASGQNGAETVTVNTSAVAHSLTFQNTGTTTLQNDSSQARSLTNGDLTVLNGAGTVTIQNNTSGSLGYIMNGSSSMVWSNGSGNDMALKGVVGGSVGTLTIAGRKAFGLYNTANTFTGNVVVSSASSVLSIGQQGAMSDACLGYFLNGITLQNGGVLRMPAIFDKGHVIINPLRPISVNNSGVIDAASGRINISSGITGTGTLTNNSGFLLLSGSNTVSGGFFVKVGLGVSSDANLGSGKLTLSANNVTFSVLGRGFTNFGSRVVAFDGGVSGSSGITIQDPNNVFILDRDNSTSINSAGACPFIKGGLGTLAVTTNQSFQNGGVGVTFNGGVFRVDYPAGGYLSKVSKIAFGGGTFELLGKTSTSVTQTLAAVRLNAGGGKLIVDNQGGSSITYLKLADFLSVAAPAVGSSLDIRTVNPGSGAAQVISSQTNDPSGLMLAGRIVYNGTDWASTDSNSNIVTYAGYTVGLPGSGADASVNYSHDGNASVTASETINTLKLTTSGVGQSLTIADGQTLALNSRGLLFTGTHDYSILGGTLGCSPTTNTDLIVNHYGTGKLIIGSSITNWMGTNVLTVAGSGTVVLVGTNTYTRATYVNGATLSLSITNQMKTAGDLYLAAGKLQATENVSMSRNVWLNGGGATFDVSNGKTLTLSGPVNGGSLILANSDGGNGMLVLSGDNSGRDNQLSDGVNIWGGILRLGHNSALNVYGLNTLSFGTATTETLQIYGSRTITVAGLVSTSANAVVENGSNATVALFRVYSGADNLYAGVLRDGTGGTLAMEKAGCGKLTLTGQNTYTGATTINGGTLMVDGSLAASAVTVNLGILAGTGTVGAVTIASNAVLSVGNSSTPATLTTGNLTLQEGAQINCDVSGTTFDEVVVNGILTLPVNATLTFNGITPVTAMPTLFRATSPIVGSPANWTGIPSSHTLVVSRDGLNVVLRPNVQGLIFIVE